ncbi:MAG: polysaccharide biosynthesis tyrosine autokinase [Candidatus Cloacimonetes bacterium]|nr:polysaccharide biosynthesis tyrosine autokinase [Candidatus Cloacimonadota bacterium]
MNNDTNNEISMLEYLKIILFYKWLVLFIILLTLVLTIVYTSTRPKIYEATSVVLLDDRNPAQDFFMFTYGGLSRSSINNTIAILNSRPVLNLALQYIERHPGYEIFPLITADDSENYDPLLHIRKWMNTSTSRETDTISISYQSTDPLEAMIVANAIADALIQQNTQFARLEFTNAREFLESQLELVIRRLQISEEDLRNFKVETGVFQLSIETDHLIERSAIANANLLSAQAEYTIAKNNLDFLQNELSIQDSLLLSVSLSISTPFIEQLKAEVVRIMSRITTLMNNNEYSPTHPEIIRLNRALENATNTLDEEIRKTLDIRAGSIDVFGFRNDLIQSISTAQLNENLASARVSSYQNIVDTFEERLSFLPDTEMELARLQRNYRIDEQIFSLLAENLEDARVAEQARMGNLRIIDRAIIPTLPVRPNKRLNLLIGGMLGIIIAVSVALILHSSDTKVRTLDDVEKYVKYPVMGTIPFMDLNDKIVNNEKSFIYAEENVFLSKADRLEKYESIRLITHYTPKSPVAEAYRTLRTNIIAKKDKGPLSMTITSSGPSEGKSTSLANLAITLAQMSSKVIIVDFDLRRPMLHNIFEQERNIGASDFLSETDIQIENIIKKSGITNLDLITSGAIPPNPSELIASYRCDELISSLKNKYDFILIDIPPVIAVTDAMIIAKKVDMLVMVIMVNSTDRSVIQRTQTMLENININVAGIIVNGIIHEKYYRGYSYYYHYYYYYYGDSKKKRAFWKRLFRKR